MASRKVNKSKNLQQQWEIVCGYTSFYTLHIDVIKGLKRAKIPVWSFNASPPGMWRWVSSWPTSWRQYILNYLISKSDINIFILRHVNLYVFDFWIAVLYVRVFIYYLLRLVLEHAAAENKLHMWCLMWTSSTKCPSLWMECGRAPAPSQSFTVFTEQTGSQLVATLCVHGRVETLGYKLPWAFLFVSTELVYVWVEFWGCLIINKWHGDQITPSNECAHSFQKQVCSQHSWLLLINYHLLSKFNEGCSALIYYRVW